MGRRSFPRGRIATVAAAAQALLGAIADDGAQDGPIVPRRRTFATATLAQTVVVGFPAQPRASNEERAQTAARCGVAVTAQAIAPRFTTRRAECLEARFRKASGHVIGAQAPLAPVRERFPAVVLMDGATITLPDALRDRVPGCGGRHGGGQAAMKRQVQWDCGAGRATRWRSSPGATATPNRRSRPSR